MVETESVRVNELIYSMCVHVKGACVCWCGSVGEREKEKTARGRRKFQDDMLVIYSSTAGFCINIDLLQLCANEQFKVCFSLYLFTVDETYVSCFFPVTSILTQQ